MRLISAAEAGRPPGTHDQHPSIAAAPATQGSTPTPACSQPATRSTAPSVHYVIPALDAGPVISQVRVPVFAGDDAQALAARVIAREHPLYTATIREIARGRIAMVGEHVGTRRRTAARTAAPARRRPPRMKWAFALLFAASGALAQPAPYVAEYEVLRNGKTLGQGTVTLSRGEGETWLLTSVTRGTKGLASMAGVEIVEKSIFQWRDGRPESIDYRFRQEAAWKTRERSVRVDAEHGRVTSREKDEVHEFVYSPFAIDRQVVALAMANDLTKGGKRGKLTYRVVDRDRFGPQTYRVGEEETVDTPAGAAARAARGARAQSRWPRDDDVAGDAERVRAGEGGAARNGRGFVRDEVGVA